jgi:hypothetical protein
MTIKQQIRAVIEHPYYQEALRDEASMEKLLFEVMFGVYSAVAGNCARVYRANKRMNGPDIVAAIRDVEPPVNLDVRLPIPEPRLAEPAMVVKMQVAHVYTPELRIRYPKHPTIPPPSTQLLLWDQTEKPPISERLSELREG